MSDKSLCAAYAFWGCGLCGTCGAQRCYIGDTGLGVLYFFTFGLCGIGACLDLCLLPGAVKSINKRNKPVVVNVNQSNSQNVTQNAPSSVTMTNGEQPQLQPLPQIMYVQQPVGQPQLMYVQQPGQPPQIMCVPQPIQPQLAQPRSKSQPLPQPPPYY